MKLYTQAKKYGAKIAVGATGLALSGLAAAQTATDPFDALFAAVDFSGVATKVGAMGIAVIGICLAYKGIDLVKRGVRKA
jgi:hypothetical protein